jgi:hypothetical protein
MNVTRKQRVSHLSMALALVCGMAVTATALEAPAHAQRKKAKKEEAKAAYSEAFVKAYQPAAPLANANPRDAAAMRAAVPAIAAAASTPDDKLAGGQFIYAAGSAANDSALQLQGLSMMLSSGKVPAGNLGQYNFIAGQLAYQAKDYAKSREYLQAAIQAGYTQNDPTLMLADTYFQQNDTAGGLTYLNQAIDRQIAAGQKPSSDLVRRGLAAAYKAQNKEQSLRFATLFARYHPSADSWGDAIVVTRSSTQLSDDELLDLLRLQRKTKTFRDGREYLSYVEMADPRKLPAEVIQVINEGYASNLLARNNTYASDSLKEAKAREAAAKADMTSLERDANASGARLATVMAAGNVFLSSGQPAKAEQFFRKALAMPGADTVTVSNRLGIAQLEQGKHADALATFNKVQGNRAAVSQLWAAYAQQQQGGTTGA